MKKIYIRYLFLLSAPLLMSTSTPVSVRYVAPYKTVAQAGIIIDGNNLFIADNDDLVSYDISQPATPAEKDRQHLSAGIDSLYMYHQNLVVCRDNFYGTDVFDVSSGAFNSSGIYWPWGSCNKVALYGDKAFVTDKPGYSCTGENPDNSVRIYNINTTATPELAGSIYMENVSGMVATENTLYVSNEKDGLVVVDIPGNTVKTSFPARACYQLQIAGTRLYARTKSTLDCYDISNPQKPVLISQFPN